MKRWTTFCLLLTMTDIADDTVHKPLSSSGNAGLRLLDACFDDVAYARYLLHSRLPADRNIRSKINWRDQQSGSSILHCLCYSDLAQPVKLLLENHADANIRTLVRALLPALS